MKFIARPMLVLALASSLAACTPPDNSQTPVAQPALNAETPTAETPTAETATAQTAEAPAVPALRALDDATRAEPLAPATNCNLEYVDGVIFAGTDISLATPSAVKITGWLKADLTGPSVEQLALRFESSDKSRVWDIPVQTTIMRDDLVVPDTNGATSGFETVVDAGAIPAGRYHLYLTYRLDGVLTGCDNGRYVVIP